jgi:hypothetical protein
MAERGVKVGNSSGEVRTTGRDGRSEARSKRRGDAKREETRKKKETQNKRKMNPDKTLVTRKNRITERKERIIKQGIEASLQDRQMVLTGALYRSTSLAIGAHHGQPYGLPW